MKSGLFLRRTALLASAGYGLACAALGTRIGSCPLASSRQSVAVPGTAVAADFDKPLDIEINLFSEISLYPVRFIDNFPELIDFNLGKVLYPCIRRDIRLGQDFLAQGRADTVDILQ
jgi:hypothetical protein